MNKMNNVQDIYPLSPVQEGMLFHTLYAASTNMYTNQISFDLVGPLNSIAFRHAWDEMIANHTVLRTAVIYEHGQKPVQVVYQTVTSPIKELDWRSFTAQEQRERLESLLEEDYKRGFSLSKPPLFRLTLIQLRENRHHLVWTTHHIILDGWSRIILIQQLFEHYHAFCQNSLLSQTAGRPYRDYISWLQKNLLQAEAFWRRQLAGKTAPTPLNIDPLSQKGPEHYLMQECTILAREWQQLRSIARQFQVTVNTLLLGAWALLLSYYSEEQDILFGMTVSGRSASLLEVESMVGVFINTLPIRIHVRPNHLFASWLQEIFALQNELLHYQQSSLVEIHRWSDIPRDLPLFESIFVFANFPIDLPQVHGLQDFQIENLRFQEENNYPFSLTVVPSDTLQIVAYYDAGCFASTAITRLLEQFQHLLTAIAAHPQGYVWEYSPLSPAERQKTLVTWNNTQVGLPYESSFQQHFEEQVARTPDAIAISCEFEQMTYLQLNRLANQCAHRLRCSGIYPEQAVAVLAPRDIRFAIALLGILKAGGVYLPVDPHHPPRRLAQLFMQSKAALVLLSEELLPLFQQSSQYFPENRTVAHLTLNDLMDSGQPMSNLLPASTPHNLSYIIYTSGSTGIPKGVMIEQRGMLNHIYAKITDLHLDAHDCIAQNASQCFDVSIWQFLSALLVGARVHIFSDELIQQPLQLLRQTVTQGVTIIETVPSWLLALLENKRTEMPELLHLRLMFVMGETLPPQLCRKWMNYYSQVLLMNAYGPTECSDDVTHYPVVMLPEADTELIPIGKPLANMRLYVLDSHLQPLPVGLAGELYIAGVGVGRGYYDDPSRTAEVFIPNVFSSQSGERLYKTGDKVRWRKDGLLEFLRRVDDQIKLRGVRIELGEIEAVLKRHACVRDAFLIIYEGRFSGDQQLLAYIIPRPMDEISLCSPERGSAQSESLATFATVQPPEPLTSGQYTTTPFSQEFSNNFVAQLRDYLKAELPAVMIPSHFILLSAFPLNANGKLDRRALPVPDTYHSITPTAYEAPRTPVEEVIAGYFAAILGIDRVGIRDNFFDLGGHSLLVTQLIARLRTTFKMDIPFRAFFEEPTISGVAQTLLSHEPKPGQVEQIAHILKKIRTMPAEEKQRILKQKRMEGAGQ